MLNEPILTEYGKLKFLKIRFFDDSRLNYEAACDFEVDDWNELRELSKTDKRFTYIEREKWTAVEFKTDDCLVYFLNPLVTEVYSIK